MVVYGNTNLLVVQPWTVFSPQPPVQSHGADRPPALVQAAAGFLQGVALRLTAASGIFIPQQNVTETEHRRYALCVLLDVPLQLLDTHREREERMESTLLKFNTRPTLSKYHKVKQ